MTDDLVNRLQKTYETYTRTGMDRRQMGRECRDAREFGDVFRTGVKLRGGVFWDWRRDLRPWLGQMLDGAKFGDPAYDWSLNAADALAADFISEASRW